VSSRRSRRGRACHGACGRDREGGERRGYVASELRAEAARTRDVEVIVVGEELRSFEGDVGSLLEEYDTSVPRERDEGAARARRRRTVNRARRDSHENDRRVRGAIARDDRTEPALPVTRVHRAVLRDREDLAFQLAMLLRPDPGRRCDRPSPKVDAQPGQLRCERVRGLRGEGVGGRRTQRGNTRFRIVEKILDVVAQKRAAQREVDRHRSLAVTAVERCRELGDVAERRLEDNRAEVGRVVIRVKAPDRARVVTVAVDRDHDRPISVGVRIDRAVEVVPGARRHPRDTGVEEAQAVSRRVRKRRIEPAVDARVAQNQHVTAPVRRPRCELRDCAVEHSRAGGGIDHARVERREEEHGVCEQDADNARRDDRHEAPNGGRHERRPGR
jgi:hypothetical protein